MKIVEIIYRLAVSLWAGGVFIFTLVVTPIIFKTQGRDLAGKIVGEIFPYYFRLGLAFGLVALVSLLYLRGRHFLPTLALLIVMLAATSFDCFYLEPKLAALKKEIPSFETTPKDHPARREFSRLHGISAVSNLTVLSGGIILIVLL